MHNDFDLALPISEAITQRSEMFCSMTATTPEEKVVLFNVMNNPTGRLAEQVNNVLCVRDIYCEVVTLQNVDETTGEVTNSNMPRIVLITTENESYACVSVGIYNAIKKLIMLFGQPTWEGGLNLKVKTVKKGKKSILTLELV